MEQRRIIAIGDIHGNYDAFREIVLGLGIVNTSLRWTAHETILVQIGDVCDRGVESRSIYRLIADWQEQARGLGSEVHFLLGNHEVMEMFGYDRDAGEEEIQGYADLPDSTGYMEHREAFAPGGWLHRWLVKQRGMLQIGPIIFGHGDLPVSFQYRAVQEIHDELITTIRESAGRIENPANLPESLFSEDQSVVWCRQSRDADHYSFALQHFLELNRASLYVCGHTPAIDGKFALKNGARYLCIDTAMGFENRGIGHRTAMVVEKGRVWEWSFYGDSIDRRRLPVRLDRLPHL